MWLTDEQVEDEQAQELSTHAGVLAELRLESVVENRLQSEWRQNLVEQGLGVEHHVAFLQ